MINAHLSPIAGETKVLAQFISDDLILIEQGTFANDAEAKRRMYFHNRNLVAEKLIGWLNQRKHAMINLQEKDIPVSLLWLVTENRYTTIKNLVLKIKGKMDDFEKCIPSSNSRQRPYYEREIEALLTWCKEA